ncbi:hypothetical protein [Pseudomonas sp. LF242]
MLRLPKHKWLTPTVLTPMPNGSLGEELLLNGEPYMSTWTRVKPAALNN